MVEMRFEETWFAGTIWRNCSWKELHWADVGRFWLLVSSYVAMELCVAGFLGATVGVVYHTVPSSAGVGCIIGRLSQPRTGRRLSAHVPAVATVARGCIVGTGSPCDA